MQLKNVVDPFGEVNVYPAGAGKTRVVATILMEPEKEGAQTGIALDGSGSMAKLYGAEGGGRVLSPIFGGPKKRANEVSPVAQKLCAYLARKLDADGGTTCIYWAVGPSGAQIEVVGDLTAEQAETHLFGPPKDFGTGTQLLPAVKYFVDRFRTAPYGFYVFITDGELHDLDDVIAYSKQLARDVASGRRNPVKFVLIGLGPDVNETQLTELDDLDTGTDIDLWDHKLASEMRQLAEIFAEVVDQNTRVAERGRILDPQGRMLKDYTTGLPAFLEFEVPSNIPYFTLDVNGSRCHQPLSDRVQVPDSEDLPEALPAAAPPPQNQKQGQGASQSQGRSQSQETPLPQSPQAPAPVRHDGLGDGPADPAAAEWLSLPLEMAKPGENDQVVDLEKTEGDK